MIQTILDYNGEEAKRFFLKGESYSNILLPKYFVFDKMLQRIDKAISYDGFENWKSKLLADSKKRPDNYDEVCYTLLFNKDAKYAYRPIQLINPVLYCLIVNFITEDNNWNQIVERLKLFQNGDRIASQSLPIEETDEHESDTEAMIRYSWWENFEQESIKLSLEYGHVLITDITNCYGSIYTHLLSWAIHTKEVAKQNTDIYGKNALLGNRLDFLIRQLQYGQTNGIPQGSVLSDFISEIVLGYIDTQLSEKLNKELLEGFKILRYRDDYRVFSNDVTVLRRIMKIISEVLAENGMKINSEKTLISEDVVSNSIKADKLFYISNVPIDKVGSNPFTTIEKELLFIYEIALKFPDSGTVINLLSDLYKRRIYRATIKTTHDYLKYDNVEVLIALIANIAYRNPKTYSICFAILSALLIFVPNDRKQRIIGQIYNRFKSLPNIGYMQIWLQRLTKPILNNLEFTEDICLLVNKESIKDKDYLWNVDWLKDKFKPMVAADQFIDFEKANNMSKVIGKDEASLFVNY